MMVYNYANIKNHLHGIAFKGEARICHAGWVCWQANWIEVEMPMQPPL